MNTRPAIGYRAHACFATYLLASIFTLSCGGDRAATPAAPSTPGTLSAPVPSLQPPVPRTPIGGQQLDTLRPDLTVTNAVAGGDVGTVMYEFELSEATDFPEGLRTTGVRDVQQGAGATSWTPPSNLKPSLRYYWRSRAKGANVSAATSWSATETFLTRARGYIVPGREIYDPLTDGETVGSPVGGRLVAGRGWQAVSEEDGLFYDFGRCTDCTVEFEVTNFGRAVGASREKDYKWLSMGDASTFGNFLAFRNHNWKMHLEQRSDGNGTGMKLIWRNGGSGNGNPGDHERRNDVTVDWRSDTVYRFTLRWSPAGFSVRVGIVNTDGTLTGDREWFSGPFEGRAFAPPLLRIALGCYPRGETMTGAIWRNVRVLAN